MNGWRFRPGVTVSVAAAAFVALCIAAGTWQTRRAEYKERLAAQLDERGGAPIVDLGPGLVAAEDLAFRRVRVRGEYLADKGLLLDNRIHNGVVGYEVLTPLRLQGGDAYVLVNRGWTKAPPTRSELPKVTTPSGPQQVEGVATLPPERVFELGSPATGPVWQHFLMERYASWSGLSLQPIVLQQTNDANDGLIREWARPDSGVAKHRGYALQWYTFALLTAILYVSLNLKRRPVGA
jgi:surfeit locus 1 family protein